MFSTIFLFELTYRLKRPATYLFFLIFFVIAFIVVSSGSGPASEKVYHNAPVVLATVAALFSMVMMLVCSAIMGVPLYRDIEHNTKDYYLTYPITKNGYFWGRFLGSFLFVVITGTSILFGCYLGSIIGPLFGWIPAARIGSNHFMFYLQPYLIIVLPNLFLASAIFFGLVAVTRNVKVIYSASILLLIAYLLSSFLMRDVENVKLVKILDPFAMNTVRLDTRFFTPAEKNTLMVPFQGMFMYNRILWTAVAFVILMATYFSFSFKKFFSGDRLKKQPAPDSFTTLYNSPIPKVSISCSGSHYWNIMLNMAKIEFLSIIRDNYFRAILMGGLIFLVIDYWIGNQIYSVPFYPLTVNLMEYKSWDYLFFIFIIIVFYTGESVHRDKTTRFAIINDALPTPDWVLYGSKLLGLISLCFIFATIPMVLGVMVQLLKGYTDFQFQVYFMELYVNTFPQMIQMVMLSFAVHIIVNNKFGGHAVALLIWIGMYLLISFADMNYNLFFYSWIPSYMWSDLNGMGHFVAPTIWFNLYWLLFGGILLVIAAMLFTRGVASSFKERFKQARDRFTAKPALLFFVLLIAFLGVGAYNYYNVSYVNNYLTVKEGEQRQVAYEKTLKKYEKLAQPKVNSIKLWANIYPDERKVTIKAYIKIQNKTDKPVSTLHLDGTGLTSYTASINDKPLKAYYPLLYKRGKFNLFRPAKDTAMYRIYKLPAVMNPGDTTTMEINSVIAYKGFSNNMSGVDIVKNGTFYAGGLPAIGYNTDGELASDEKRKKYKLRLKEDEYPPQNDPIGIKTLLFNDDADLVSMDMTVSTAGDQTAVAPGYLQSSWKKGGRNYFRYIQDDPEVDLFFDVVSAKYTILRDNVTLPSGKNVGIELYYHHTHDANLRRLTEAYKDGLIYFSKAYGDFQFKQMRLLEFPKYRSFAQSFPNTVSYAESFGWTADFSDPNTFDYAYFVTAHELAHQWWGHQVVPNRTRGSNLISEALAEYTALLLTEKKFGKDNMKRFLKQELENYLRGRANEAKKENVFINCNRAYEWYYKGSLILYGLRDLIGEQELNTALKEFRDEYAFRKDPPYPGSNDLYRHIEQHVPDSLTYYLEDTWKKITLYDNKVVSSRMAPTGKKDEYKVTLKISSIKMYADSAGNEKPAKRMNDYVDIGIFGAESKDKNGRTQTNPLYLKKHRFTSGTHTVDVVVKGKPVKAGIDPYIKLIDRIPDDNISDL